MINVRKIRADYDLTNLGIATTLFPKAKNPMASLMRVFKGEYELREHQIRDLAKLMKITPGQLMDSEYVTEYPIDDLM
jgi:hypothetical protein